MAFSTFRFDTAGIVPKIQEISRGRYLNRNHINSIGTLLLTSHHEEVLCRPYKAALLTGRNCFGGTPHPGSSPCLDLHKDELLTPLAHDVQLTAGTAPVARHNSVALLLQPGRRQVFATSAEPFAGTGIGATNPGSRLQPYLL
jgi:hypothetical protein